MKISVTDDRALQGVVLGFRLAGRDLRKRMNDGTRAKLNAPWKSGIESRTKRPLERAVLAKGARIAAGNPPNFVAASSTRALRGGLVPDVQWAPVEFGAFHDTATYTATSPKGKRYPVTRHTANQLPTRRPKGPVFNTLAEMSGRAAKLWAQIIVKVYSDAAEGN